MVQNHPRLPFYKKEGPNNGEAKRKFHIIDCDGYWTVKKRFKYFWFYVRDKKFKKLKFYEFGKVVRYVNERK